MKNNYCLFSLKTTENLKFMYVFKADKTRGFLMFSRVCRNKLTRLYFLKCQVTIGDDPIERDQCIQRPIQNIINENS